MSDSFARIQDFLAAKCGLRFEGEREASLRHALGIRLAARDLRSLEEYLPRLEQETAEFNDLVSLLTIGETYFYREPDHLKLLTRRFALPLGEEENQAAPIRILSAGCSTGEEPYSIAIALMEAFGAKAQRRFILTGIDIDGAALTKAQAACYGPPSFRALPYSLRAHYFQGPDPAAPLSASQSQNQWRLKPEIRQWVQWRRVNLLDPFPPSLGSQDVVFLRNVAIYFDATTRRDLITRLSGLLVPGGMLIVGMAETLALDMGILPLVQEDGLFLFRKPGAPHPTATDRPRAASKAVKLREIKALSQESIAALQSARRLLRDHHLDAALAELEAIPGNEARILRYQIAALQACRAEDYAEAERAVHHSLTLDPLNIDGLFLMGRICHLRGHWAAAQSWFRQVIFLQPGAWESHYRLAESHRLSGERDLAAREYRLASQSLDHQDEAEASPLFPVSPEAAILSRREWRALCDRRLTTLGMAPTLATPPVQRGFDGH